MFIQNTLGNKKQASLLRSISNPNNLPTHYFVCKLKSSDYNSNLFNHDKKLG